MSQQQKALLSTLRLTNWLLLGLLLALLAHVGWQGGRSTPGHADAEEETTFRKAFRTADDCITTFPNEKPNCYTHVVTHNFAGD